MSLSEMSVAVILNIALVAIVAFGCAAIPLLVGRMVHRPDLGNPRAKTVVIIATIMGLFGVIVSGGWKTGLYWGILVSIIFSLGIIVAARSKPKRTQPEITV